MLTDVLRRPMFMQGGGMTMPMPAQPTDNVGIMDGFAQGQPMENPIDQAKDYAGLMNLIRGNEASVEDRREELSQIVGRTDAMKTPESVLTLVQPTLAQFEQSAQAQQGIGSIPEAQQMMQGAGDMGQGTDQQLAQDQQQVDMAQATGQPIEAQEGIFTGVGGRTFYVDPTGGVTSALPNRLPTVIPQANVPAIRPIPGVPALGTNIPGLGIGASYNLGQGTVAGVTPSGIISGGGSIPPSSPGMLSKLFGYGKGALKYGTGMSLGLSPFYIFEEDPLKNNLKEKQLQETAEELQKDYYGQPRKKLMEDILSGTKSKAESPYAEFDFEKARTKAEKAKTEYLQPKKEEKVVPPPEKKFKAKSIDEILNSDEFKKTQTAYEKLYGYDPDFLKGQAYQQLAQFGLNLASAKGGNTVQKIAESAKSPLATFAAIGAEAQKVKREGRIEAGKGAIKEAEFEKKIEQYGEFGITPKEAILGAKTGDLKDLENARTAIQTGYSELVNKLPKEQRSIVIENAAAIYKQEPTTAGLKKAENYIVNTIKQSKG